MIGRYRQLLNNFYNSSQSLKHAKEKRSKLSSSRFGYYSKLMKANRRCQILQKDYDVCKEAMTDFFIDDEDWRQWDKSAIVIEGNLLNIYYGKKDAFSKGHGHYAINLRSGSVIYHRSLNKPHGSQNYCNARPQTSNL